MDNGLEQIEKPLAIDAIRCRLRQDIDIFKIQHTIPADELKLLLDIVDAARLCVREWAPSNTDKRMGHGTTQDGTIEAQDRLIMAVRAWPQREGDNPC